jgi:hypothetical protein
MEKGLPERQVLQWASQVLSVLDYLADLCRCLIFVRDTLRDHPMLVNPVLRDLARRIGRGFDWDVVPDPAFRVIQQALAKAKPVLRPEVDPVAPSLSLLGLVVI